MQSSPEALAQLRQVLLKAMQAALRPQPRLPIAADEPDQKNDGIHPAKGATA